MTTNTHTADDANADELIEKIQNSRFASNGCFVPRRKKSGVDGDEDTRGYLSEQWKVATQGLGLLDEQVVAEWFDRIYRMHAENTRHYHTPVHLEEMCCYLQVLVQENSVESSTPIDLQAMLLASFFHDVVYDAQSSTNEEDSAKLFESFAQQVRLPSSLVTTVVKYILATKKHEVSSENPPDLAIFLDLDMAVLGKKTAAYMQYASLIRKEYNFVPHNVYCQKRADVLETFLKQDRIYGTMVMHAAFENQARSNIQKEIVSLRQGMIPCDDEKQSRDD